MKNCINMHTNYVQQLLDMATNGQPPDQKVLINTHDENGKLVKTTSVRLAYDPVTYCYSIEWIP